MRNYKLYKASDFALDPDFIQWVYEGKNDAFWHKWISDHPEKALVIAEARQLVESLRQAAPTITSNQIEEEVHRLLMTIRPRRADLSMTRSPRRWWWIAAASIILLGTGTWLASHLSVQSGEMPYSYTVITKKKALVEQVNTSGKALHILLPDSSTVELAPQSRLSYSNDMRDSANRDVFLLGEAFFSVKKNPGQPFRVFTNGIVTRVLGTSFTVRSFEKENTIKVTVRTGKVKVYTQIAEEATMPAEKSDENVLLSPNQEVIFEKAKQTFRKKILEKPVIIAPGISLQSMIYEETPVTTVFEEFKKAYGISILYDEDVLKHCTITADLTDESLYSRLDLICRAIDADYEIINSEIFIRGKGCH